MSVETYRWFCGGLNLEHGKSGVFEKVVRSLVVQDDYPRVRTILLLLSVST